MYQKVAGSPPAVSAIHPRSVRTRTALVMSHILRMAYNLALLSDSGHPIKTVVLITWARCGRMDPMAGTLVLLRHGFSEWNAKNLFTGWVDVDLTAQGESEARRGGELLREHDLLPDVVHTSVLRRAIRTADITLNVIDRHWIAVRRSWRLNERHYGALQGKNKKQTLEQYGEEQFML